MLVLRQLSLITVAILLSKLFVINDIGELEGLQYLLLTFTIFWVNGLLQWILPTYQNTLQEEKILFLQRVFFIFLALTSIIFVFFLLNKTFVFSFFLKQSPVEHNEIFFLYGLFFIPTFLLEYTFFLKKKYTNILIFSILTFLFQNAAVLIAGFFQGGIFELLCVWLILAIIRFIALVVELDFFKFKTVKSTSWTYFQIFSSAFPLIAYAFIGQWAVAFDAWLVNWYYNGDSAQFAIFRYGAREFPIVMALATGLSNAASASIASDYENGVNALKNKSLQLMHWLFPLTFLLLISSDFLYPLVFSNAFRDSVIIFDIFLILIVSRLLFPHTVAVGLRMFKEILVISITELLLNIILSAIFVQYWGIAGIAFGTWIACLFEKLAIAFWLYYKKGISISSYMGLNYWTIYSALLMICFAIKYY